MTTDELRKALEPFAKIAEGLGPEIFDSDGEKVPVPIGDLRRARTAYAALGDIREATIEETDELVERVARAIAGNEWRSYTVEARAAIRALAHTAKPK